MGGILNKLFSGSSGGGGGSHSAETVGCNVFKQHHLSKKNKLQNCANDNDNNNTDLPIHNNDHRASTNYHRHSSNKVAPGIITNNNNNNSKSNSNSKRNSFSLKVDDDKTNNKVTAEDTTMTEDEEPNSLEPSPFQRDFGPHQMLVSLEKHRPRRSNIRRSSRNPLKNAVNSNAIAASLSTSSADDNLKSSDTLPSVSISQNINKLSIIKDVSFTEDLDSSSGTPIDTELKIEQQLEKDNQQQAVDELAPNERQKVARSRISNLFMKRQTLQMPIGMIGTELPQKSADNGNDCDIENLNTDTALESVSSSSGEQTPVTPGSPAIKSAGDGPSESTNNCNNLPMSNENLEEVARRPEIVPRRRPNTMAFGNPRLIDELKKRQSTFQVDVNRVN